jgi:hypothetical protein
MNNDQRESLKTYINAYPRTTPILQDTGEYLEDFSDQNLLVAALLVAYHQGLLARNIRPFFGTKFNLQADELREALELLVQHIIQNNY